MSRIVWTPVQSLTTEPIQPRCGPVYAAPHADPALQAKREKARVQRQAVRARAAERAALAKELGVVATPAKRGPVPLPDEAVSTKYAKKFETARYEWI